MPLRAQLGLAHVSKAPTHSGETIPIRVTDMTLKHARWWQEYARDQPPRCIENTLQIDVRKMRVCLYDENHAHGHNESPIMKNMTTPMSVYARIAERFGVDSRDDEAVDEFFLNTAPALPEAERERILDELLDASDHPGERTSVVARKKLKSTVKLLSIEDAPPFALPRGAFRPDRPAERHVGKQWYIVRTSSGFEKRVKENLTQRIDALGMRRKFGEIMIPDEALAGVTVTAGEKLQAKRKSFPGCILVEMEMADDAWHVVKSTPKVTGFVGPGEEVQIIDGPFKNFTGLVQEVNVDRNLLKLAVTIFGRSTIVEVDFLQVTTVDAVDEKHSVKRVK